MAEKAGYSDIDMDWNWPSMTNSSGIVSPLGARNFLANKMTCPTEGRLVDVVEGNLNSGEKVCSNEENLLEQQWCQNQSTKETRKAGYLT
jgi:hypothetical protein